MIDFATARCPNCDELVQPYYPLMLNGVYTYKGTPCCSSDCSRELREREVKAYGDTV